MTRNIVLASNNAKKLAEMHALLAPLGWQVQSQSEFDAGEAEEPHATFVENALAKARFAAVATGLPAIADDSGIVVPALNGAPGVISALYAGLPKSDANNNALLLKNMQNITDRRAHFFSCVVLLRHANDPQPIIAQGMWHGEILHAPRGTGGFGYDPLFFDPVQQLGAAEMSAELKNQVSHRGKAMQQLMGQLGDL
ncbi:MAG: non-canonical purine pyrophosphatase, RdgB/HAM1 family [Pseudomonadota bacterium]|jgi:XTP/dITP diphosphohydrolase